MPTRTKHGAARSTVYLPRPLTDRLSRYEETSGERINMSALLAGALATELDRREEARRHWEARLYSLTEQ